MTTVNPLAPRASTAAAAAASAAVRLQEEQSA